MPDHLTYSLGDKLREAIEIKAKIELAKWLLSDWWAKKFDETLFEFMSHA